MKTENSRQCHHVRSDHLLEDAKEYKEQVHGVARYIKINNRYGFIISGIL